MLRLLQGDVGSGKTVVAMAALLNAVECGAQGALMAPTEILARQHMTALEPMAKAAGVRMAILTGREKGLAREQTLKALENGLIDILVGTHALFSEDVTFRDLALAVVDEQHRFGVHHRMKLQGKGDKPVDVLVMTATPIPRTLALTAYGDMEVSRLTEKPAGRKPVETRVLSAERTRRNRAAPAPRNCEGRARILGVPAGGRIREERPCSSRDRARRIASGAGCAGRAGAWPMKGRGSRRRDGEI